MYVKIKVADEQDARMVRDLVSVLMFPMDTAYATIEKGEETESGWWFVCSYFHKDLADRLLDWASDNEVKIFSIETGSGETYYEAES